MQQVHGPGVDSADRDVDEVHVRLFGEDAGDVVLEADPQPAERFAEQLARHAVGEGLVELLVRDETLAQQQCTQL